MNLFALAPSATPARVISGDDVSQFLCDLDPSLTEELFATANSVGLAERFNVTSQHPSTAGGFYHWAEVVRFIRTELERSKSAWRSFDKKNCPFVISKDKSIAIVIMTGCTLTGKNGGDPTNQSEKGAVLEEAIRGQLQYDLFENDAIRFAKNKKDSSTQVWAFLYHYDVKSGILYSELSLPSGFRKRRITQFTWRVLLNPLQNKPEPFKIEPLPIEPIDIPILRKSE